MSRLDPYEIEVLEAYALLHVRLSGGLGIAVPATRPARGA